MVACWLPRHRARRPVSNRSPLTADASTFLVGWGVSRFRVRDGHAVAAKKHYPSGVKEPFQDADIEDEVNGFGSTGTNPTVVIR